MGLPDHPVPSSRGLLKMLSNYLSITENIFKLLNIKKDKSLKIFNEINNIIKRTSETYQSMISKDLFEKK